MPWLLAQPAETLAPGSVELGAGVGVLVAPGALLEPFPVPQAWARVGLMDGMDAGLAWVPPMGFALDAKARVARRGPLAYALTAGGGVQGFPDILTWGRPHWSPFLAGGALASHGERRVYGGVRAVIPFVVDDAAFALWLIPSLGVRRDARGWALRTEAGAVVPASRPVETLLLIGVSASRPVRDGTNARRADRAARPAGHPPRRRPPPCGRPSR